MGRGLAILIVASGCGRIAFDPRDDGGGGGGSDDVRLLDAPADACAFGTFANPAVVPNINSPSVEYSMSLTSDGLLIVFQSFRGPSGDIFQATRTSTSAQFGAATPIAELNSTSLDGAVSITDDGLEVAFFSGRSGPLDLWHARRTSTADVFPTPILVLSNPATEVRDAPEISADALEIYYTYGNATRDIHRASRPNIASTFTDNGPVTEINSAQDDALAALSSDGLELIVQSNRGGANRLYRATRATKAAPFGTPQPLPDLDALGAGLSDPELADNGRELYFTLDTGSRDIWSARRPCN
jgi:hypothetical protein